MVTSDLWNLVSREFGWRERAAFLLVLSFVTYVVVGAVAMLLHMLGSEQADLWMAFALISAPPLVFVVCHLLPIPPSPAHLGTSSDGWHRDAYATDGGSARQRAVASIPTALASGTNGTQSAYRSAPTTTHLSAT